MAYQSTVVITKEGKWFVARSVELGVVSQGKSIEGAQKNLLEAIELYLEDSPEKKRYLVKSHPLVTSVEVRHG